MKNPQLESTDATSGYDLTPPHGLDEIIATFGNIYEYIGTGGQLAPRWQSDFLAKTMAVGFPCKNQLTLPHAPRMGPFPHHHSDDVPPPDDWHLCLCLRRHTEKRA